MKINELGVKQSVHIAEGGFTAGACDVFATHVHNVGPEKRGWNSD